MKNTFKFPVMVTLCISIISVIVVEIAIMNLAVGAWQILSMLILNIALVLDLYLLWQFTFINSPVSKGLFYTLIAVTLSFIFVPFILQRIQPIGLLLWLFWSLTLTWRLSTTLFVGGSINEFNGLKKIFGENIDPTNLLILCFSFSIFTPILYEAYQRIGYETRREQAIETALQRTNIRFNLYAQLFKSIDEPLLKFVHHPNVSLLFQDPETDYYQMSVQTNSLGFRDDEFDPEEITEEDFVVVFIGDSVTFGVGVEANQTFVEQSESLIADHIAWQGDDSKVWHINMGVGSYGLIEVIEAVKFADVSQFKPDAIVYSYNVNDYSSQVRGLDQETGALVPFKPRSFLVWDLRQLFRPQSVDTILGQKLDELVSLTNELDSKLIINILPSEPTPHQYPSTFQYNDLFNQSYGFIKDYVAGNQLAFIDGLSIFKEESLNEYLFIRPNFRDDGNHYNQLGHNLMANLVTVTLLDAWSADSSSSSIQSLAYWGDDLLANGRFSEARDVYDLIFQFTANHASASHTIPVENLNLAIQEDLYSEIAVYLDFSSSTSSTYFDFESKIPSDWDWRVFPECPQGGCSLSSCLAASCSLVDDIGLLVSDRNPIYQDFPSKSLSGSSGTVVFWYRPEASIIDGPTARLLWSYWLDADNRAYINLNQEQGLVAGFKTAEWQTVSYSVDWQAKEWHQVAMTWDTEFPTLKLYVDGQLVADSLSKLELPVNGGRESIGAWANNGTAPANGHFAEILIFPDRLTAHDIQWLYETRLVSYKK